MGDLGQGAEASHYDTQEAKQLRISSILLQSRLRFLGHLSRMSNDRLSKQLLVSTRVGCKRNVSGQKRRWNDIVSGELKKCNLLESWGEKAEECNSWRSIIKRSAEHFKMKSENKKRRASEMTQNDGMNNDS